MPSLHKHMRTFFGRLLILGTVCLGASGCVGGDEIDTTAVAPTYTEYSVEISAAGKTLPFNVRVSSSMADHYAAENGRTLDVAAVEELVGDRVRHGLELGLLELSADEAGEYAMTIDFELTAPEAIDPNAFQPTGCVNASGYERDIYTVPVKDSFGCRTYYYTDWYDHLVNSCNNTAYRGAYLKTTTDAIAWGVCG